MSDVKQPYATVRQTGSANEIIVCVCVYNAHLHWILYCIICKNCGEEYIGQTGTQLTARKRKHRQQINDSSIRYNPCSKHFDNCAMGNY